MEAETVHEKNKNSTPFFKNISSESPETKQAKINISQNKSLSQYQDQEHNISQKESNDIEIIPGYSNNTSIIKEKRTIKFSADLNNMNLNQIGLPSPISPIPSNLNTNTNFYSNPNNQSNNENNFESITLKTEEIPGSEIHKQTQDFNDNNTEYGEFNKNNYKSQNTLQLDNAPPQNVLSGSKFPYVKKMSDNTFNDFLTPNNRDSRLNLSISRISLKNNFQDTTSSKLRSVYKKQNENSILNITNVNAKENQFIKFFTNNSLYDGKGNIIDLNSSNKDKIVSSAQTAKKLASDVIDIYRDNVSQKLKTSEEKPEAKEVINKQINSYRILADNIVKKEMVQETDVETIMRVPVHKYANSVFPGFKNNMTFQSGIGTNQINSKVNITAIDATSRVLSPIRNVKSKVQEEINKETTYEFKPKINKNNKVKSKVTSQLTSVNSSLLNGKKATDRDGEMKMKNGKDKCEGILIDNLNEVNHKNKLERGLIINKYKDLVEHVIWN